MGFEKPPDLRTNSPTSSNSFNAVFTEDLHLSISVPGHTKSYKEILHFEKFEALAKTSETESTEASALTPSCIHISFFSRLVSISNCCKKHFYAVSKNVLTYIQKMKGINTGS